MTTSYKCVGKLGFDLITPEILATISDEHLKLISYPSLNFVAAGTSYPKLVFKVINEFAGNVESYIGTKLYSSILKLFSDAELPKPDFLVVPKSDTHFDFDSRFPAVRVRLLLYVEEQLKGAN